MNVLLPDGCIIRKHVIQLHKHIYRVKAKNWVRKPYMAVYSYRIGILVGDVLIPFTTPDAVKDVVYNIDKRGFIYAIKELCAVLRKIRANKIKSDHVLYIFYTKRINYIQNYIIHHKL